MQTFDPTAVEQPSVPREKWERPVGRLITSVLLDQLDDARKVLTEPEQRKLETLANDDAINALLETELGSTLVPDVRRAFTIFNRLERQNVTIPSMVLVLEFFTLNQYVRMLEENRRLLMDKTIRGSDRVLLHSRSMEAIERFSAIVHRIRTYARLYRDEKKKAKSNVKPVQRQVTGVAPSLD